MNLILSHEKVMVNGKSIPKIYGGFAAGQPSVLAKQVAEIHEYEVREINQLVNKNLDWFDEGIDYLDLKPFISKAYPGVISNDPSEFLVKSGFYPNSQAIGGAKYIYVFSQQGYAMLCKLLKSDLAKQIYKQMIRDYFRMIENQQNCENPRESLVKQKGSVSEGCWFSGKLAEIILEGIHQNREEMNLLHLEFRGLKERLETIENKISGRNTSKHFQRKEYSSSSDKIEQINTGSFISKQQGQILQKLVKDKATSQKEMLQIWSEFKKQFEVSRYVHLPKEKFNDALKWLKNLNRVSFH